MKRLFSFFLTAAMLLALASCGNQEQENEAAKGRYVEQEVLSLNGPALTKLYCGADGKLVFFIQGEEEVTRVSYNPAADSQDEAKLPAAPAGMYVIDAAENEAGDIFALLNDFDQETMQIKNQVVKLVEGAWQLIEVKDLIGNQGEIISFGGTELYPGATVHVDADGVEEEAGGEIGFFFNGANEELKEGEELQNGTMLNWQNMLSPNAISALNNGNLAIHYGSSGVREYTAEGELVRSFEGTSYQGSSVWGQNKLVLNGGNGKIAVTDLTSGEMSLSSEFESSELSLSCGAESDGVFYIDSTGIYRQAFGGSIWERLVDGSLTSLTMPMTTILGISSDGEGGYWAMLGDAATDDSRLVHYVFDPEMPLTPDTELTIFALKDSNTIRQAIGLFQRRNPNVRVNFRVADASGAATTEDLVRALNTELLGGKGPDILVLDGLPVESYIEKGVLQDVSAYLHDGLYHNLMSAYERGGGTYAIPIRFRAPVALGELALLNQLNSLADLAALVEQEQGGTPALLYNSFADSDGEESYGIYSSYYSYFARSMIDENGALNEAALTDYLTQIGRIDEAMARAYDASTTTYYAASVHVASGSASMVDVLQMGASAIAGGNNRLAVQDLTSEFDFQMMMLSFDQKEHLGVSALFQQGLYQPVQSMGIVSGTKQADLAGAFLELLLSPEIQDMYLYDGLPVNQSSYERIVKTGLEDDAGNTYGDLGLLTLPLQLTTPMTEDSVVREAVLRQTSALREGSITVAQAVEEISLELDIYLAE